MDRVDYLKEKGFIHLTGEACAFSMRVLFDIETEEAKEILEEFLGCKLSLLASWNRGIGSIMLTHNAIADLHLFLLLKENEVVYSIIPEAGKNYNYRRWVGVTLEKWNNEVHRKLNEHGYNYIVKFGGGHSRNRHAMSGRLE